MTQISSHANALARPIDIYLVSSTLHFFWAFMLAKKHEGQRESHLWVIDQYTHKPLIMLNYMKGALSPFATYEVLNGRELKGLDKLQNRRHQFDKLKKMAQKRDVNRVFIGNDRSVIGQFFIKELKANNPEVIAGFLDDGVFSYLGREASQKWSEKWFDAFFKKLAYGLWYDVPASVGASKWIDEVWVMFPDLVNSSLREKKRIEILPDNHGFDDLKPLSEKIFIATGIKPETLQAIDVFITLPNETVFSKINGYQSSMRLLISELIAIGKNVAIKYHPAAGKKDLLNLEKLGAYKLPSNVNFEMFIPFLKDCQVIGDFSTTVLATHYSQSASVVMLANTHSDSEPMVKLCQALGITVESLDSLQQKFAIESA